MPFTKMRDDFNKENPQKPPKQQEDEPSSMDIEQSVPTVAQIRGKSDHDIDDDSRYRTSTGCLVTILLAVLGLVIIIVGLVIVDVRGDEEAASSYASSSTDLIQKQRFSKVVEYLKVNGISNQQDLLFDDSSQNRAAKWLAYEDPSQRQVPSASINDREGYRFMERYIMAVFYFHLRGSNNKWKYSANFLSEDDTCDWYSVFLTSVGRDTVGVQCNDDGFIAGLYFINVGLSGPLPKEVGKLNTLQVLELDGNSISGSIPNELQSLTNLENFHMSHNYLRGSLPSFLVSLPKLISLDVSFNEMNGLLPSGLATMTRLMGLALDHNYFSGTIPTATIGLKYLRHLFLEHNLLTGNIDESWLLGLPEVIMLDLSDNKLEGTLPNNLFDDTTNLRVLDLHDNHFEGTIPHALPNSTVLEYLSLQKNALTGELPESISNLRKLSHLDVSSNQLTGYKGQSDSEMRFGLPAMTNLTYLFLAENHFAPAPVPTWLAQMTQLEELSLKSLSLEGDLPAVFGNMSNLILLDLDNNGLTGPLPVELGNLNKLQFMLLNRNGFTGGIPPAITNLPLLRKEQCVRWILDSLLPTRLFISHSF